MQAAHNDLNLLQFHDSNITLFTAVLTADSFFKWTHFPLITFLSGGKSQETTVTLNTIITRPRAKP